MSQQHVSQVTSADIDKLVEGQTVSTQFLATVAARPDQVALRWQNDDDSWGEWTWSDYGDLVARAAAGLADRGVSRGDRIVLMLRNIPQFHVLDMAAYFVGATPVSIYNSSAPEQVEYLVNHSEAKLGFVEDIGFLERFLKVRSELPHLEHLGILHDPDGMASDEVFGWDEDYQTLRDAGVEAVKEHPGAYASGVLDTVWQQLSEPYYREVRAAPAPPARADAETGLPPPSEGQLIPGGQNLWILRPDNAIRQEWTSPTAFRFVFDRPADRPRRHPTLTLGDHSRPRASRNLAHPPPPRIPQPRRSLSPAGRSGPRVRPVRRRPGRPGRSRWRGGRRTRSGPVPRAWCGSVAAAEAWRAARPRRGARPAGPSRPCRCRTPHRPPSAPAPPVLPGSPPPHRPGRGPTWRRPSRR